MTAHSGKYEYCFDDLTIYSFIPVSNPLWATIREYPIHVHVKYDIWMQLTIWDQHIASKVWFQLQNGSMVKSIFKSGALKPERGCTASQLWCKYCSHVIYLVSKIKCSKSSLACAMWNKIYYNHILTFQNRH